MINISMRLTEKNKQTEAELLVTASKSRDINDFLRNTSPIRSEPKTLFSAYDQNGIMISQTANEESAKRMAENGMTIEKIVPSRQKITAYRCALAKREHCRDLYNKWSEEGRFNGTYGFNIDDVVFRRVRFESSAYEAVWMNRRVGAAIIGYHDDADPPDVVRIYKSAVEDKLKRRGIGTKLYDYVEADLAKKGLHLMPSPVLSDEGIALWRKRDIDRLRVVHPDIICLHRI